MFAAGLFAKGVHEFREFFEIEWSVVAAEVWNITSGPLAEGATLHDFLKGIFGLSPHPEQIRVATYLAYLIPVTALFYRKAPEATAPTKARERVGATS